MNKKNLNIYVEGKNVIYYIFEGSPYFPIDNFYPNIIVEYEGLIYTNSEAAFQAAKTKDMNMRKLFTTMDASEAKYCGKNPNFMFLRPDWDEVKDQVMYDIVKNKMLNNPECLKVLKSTGNKLIQEGNFWGDLYWGVDYYTKRGKNQLGKTLMRLREELK
jgi:ribA/ribD-fused uncharacterized protein